MVALRFSVNAVAQITKAAMSPREIQKTDPTRWGRDMREGASLRASTGAGGTLVDVCSIQQTVDP
jgi:hypothetical protein